MESEHKRLRELTPEEIHNILQRGFQAHLGCHSHGETYVCPISYAYEDGYLFSHSLMGKKINMMRANPKVCLQVEEVHSLFNWESVIAWGQFEELKDGLEAETVLRLLKMKIAKLGGTQKVSDLAFQLDAILSEAVIYRIRIEKVTGRAEGR